MNEPLDTCNHRMDEIEARLKALEDKPAPQDEGDKVIIEANGLKAEGILERRLTFHPHIWQVKTVTGVGFVPESIMRPADERELPGVKP